MNSNAQLITAHGRTLSVRGWSREMGLAESTIRNRLRRGMTGEDAVRPSASAPTTLTVGGVTKTLPEWARERDIPYATLAYRVSRGFPPEQCLAPTGSSLSALQSPRLRARAVTLATAELRRRILEQASSACGHAVLVAHIVERAAADAVLQNCADAWDFLQREDRAGHFLGLLGVDREWVLGLVRRIKDLTTPADA